MPPAKLSPRLRRRLILCAVAAALISPIWLLNVAVAFFGRSLVFPLSPFHLADKARALAAYARHRPLCFFRSDVSVADAIARAQLRHRLPRGLLAALIEVESGGRIHRISPCGAMGPAQLMPSTARELGVRDPFDPAQNIDGGARYLREQLTRFGDVRRALAAYNAGPGAARAGIPRNGETPQYVAKIMRLWRPARAAVSARVAARR